MIEEDTYPTVQFIADVFHPYVDMTVSLQFGRIQISFYIITDGCQPFIFSNRMANSISQQIFPLGIKINMYYYRLLCT